MPHDRANRQARHSAKETQPTPKSKPLYRGNGQSRSIKQASRHSPFNRSIITTTYHHPNLLQEIKLPLNQTCLDFERVVINDGKGPTTQDLRHNNSLQFQPRYREIDHPLDSLGLYMTRNLRLETAQGDSNFYFDDDNALRSAYVATIVDWCEQHPRYFGLLPQQ